MIASNFLTLLNSVLVNLPIVWYRGQGAGRQEVRAVVGRACLFLEGSFRIGFLGVIIDNYGYVSS